jgi:SAM-dependent methyltransferase
MGVTDRQDGDDRAARLAAESIEQGQVTGWFDRLYREAEAGRTDVPWDRAAPHPLVAEWLAGRRLDAVGRSAMVVGCGLGYDAELVAAAGFAVTAFDVAETGIAMARARHPGSPVHYRTADLFELPDPWQRAFDLVVEVFTVQSLPVHRHAEATACVTGLVAPGGTLLVVAASRAEHSPDPDGPPWPLTPAEVEAFASDGLDPVRVERLPHPDDARVLRWRVELFRPPGVQ